MADEATISTTEEIVGQEGSVATLENATPETPETKLVPEHDLLAVKDKAQRKESELKARIAELEARIPTNTSSLASKYEGVDADFIADIERLTEKKAEEKVAPLLKQFQAEKAQKDIDKLIDDRLALAEGIDINKVDRELLKDLALLPKNRNVDIKDIAEKLYKVESSGRATTENDTRAAMDIVKNVVDVDNISKEDLDKIWQDPKARKEYLDKKYS